jgi:uncharacterized OsmC-like protein
MTGPSNIREYAAQARSTETFGRVQCSARNHHFLIDGPVQNGCPGEEVTPGEAFLAGVASCGVELVQVIAREKGLAPTAIHVGIRGVIDRANPVRSDCTVFNSVRVAFELRGVTEAEANDLVGAFRKR